MSNISLPLRSAEYFSLCYNYSVPDFKSTNSFSESGPVTARMRCRLSLSIIVSLDQFLGLLLLNGIY